ncbi:MAG: glycosyltransferase [Anaerolineaceae bacterium]|nr:MAG: glycosyltransferase [Anaerolineaceae bacterium]
MNNSSMEGIYMNTKNIKIFIFGCSARVGQIKKSLSNINGIKIIGYVDNDEKKWDTFFFNMKVYSPYEAYERYINDETIYFLIAPKNFIPIKKQLKCMGIERVYVHLYELLEYNSFIYEDNIIEHNKQVLLVSNGGLPKEDNRYRLGFVHRRILAYKNSGMTLDSYGYIEKMGISKYEFEGNSVYEGDGYGLSYLLSKGQYKKVLVHFPTEEVLYYIEKYINGKCDIYVWLHGYEILKWERRLFNYSKDEIAENFEQLAYMNKEKEGLFKRIFVKDNFHFIFVSNWLKNVVKKDFGILPINHRIIPNYIDSELFSYVRKKRSDVTKILLIKSHKTRMYANDIASKAIENLATRECFNKMEFNIYGDGELYDKNFQSLITKNYPNVHLYRKFLTQIEIAQLHKSHGIFLCPTRQDTQGVSMCEAMSSGLVVITNNVAAVPEYITDTAGILCDYEDYMGMADAVEKLFYNRDMFLEFSGNAARFIREKCGFEKTIQVELDLINS